MCMRARMFVGMCLWNINLRGLIIIFGMRTLTRTVDVRLNVDRANVISRYFASAAYNVTDNVNVTQPP